MKLNFKIAKTLRRWAEKLDPIFPYNKDLAPQLRPTTYDIQKVICQHSVSRRLYEQNPEYFNRLVREDIYMSITKELDARNLAKIMIDPTPDSVTYTAELDIIDYHNNL